MSRAEFRSGLCWPALSFRRLVEPASRRSGRWKVSGRETPATRGRGTAGPGFSTFKKRATFRSVGNGGLRPVLRKTLIFAW